MWTESNYQDRAVKEICYNCGSKTAKKSYSFFKRMEYLTGGKSLEKVLCSVWYLDGVPAAFFYANKSRSHVRLIEIAVKKDLQGKGIGRKILFRLLSLMKEHGIDTLTFRTPINEQAQFFWLKMGARITGMKGDDYEMELKIKI